MPRTLGSPQQDVLCAFLIEARHKAKLTQADVAKRLRRHQSFVATVESGQRRIDVVEMLDFADAMGFDPRALLRRLQATPRG